MKPLLGVTVLLSLLFLGIPAYSNDNSIPLPGLIGKWTGAIHLETETRTLELLEDKPISTGSGAFEIKGQYGVTGKKMSSLTVTLVSEKGKPNLQFKTGANATVIISEFLPHRMEGIFKTPTGNPRNIQFWKTGVAITDQTLRELLGTWEGTWTPTGHKVRLHVEYIDSEAASLRYEVISSIQTRNIQTGCWWHNAKVTIRPVKAFDFSTSSRDRMEFRLSGSRLYGERKETDTGRDSNSIKMEKLPAR